MIIYGGQGFVSGSASLSTLGDAWAYDMRRSEWTLLQDIRAEPALEPLRPDNGLLPSPRSSHACAIVNSDPTAGTADFLSFGGLAVRQYGSGANVVNELWRLHLIDQRVTGAGDLVQGTWQRVSSSTTHVPLPRFDHTAVVYNNAVLIYGGCASTSAYEDVWRLDFRGPDLSAGAAGAAGTAGTSTPLPAASGAWTPLTAGASSAVPVLPPPSPPPGVGDPFAGHDSPGRRCAHAAVSSAEGMIAFGGRFPHVPPGGNPNDPTWLSLADIWVFDVAAAAAAGGRAGWLRMPLLEPCEQCPGSVNTPDVNRSDHTAVVRDGYLMVFGGLETRIVENTIYIMKDWLNIELPTSPSAAAQLEQLSWGPDWRFDHTMVTAPKIRHPEHPSRTLTNAPLLYGGAGGREIFNDLWVFDHAENEWLVISWAQTPSPVFEVITSLLFGTVGFGLYACIIVCVFVRRLARTSVRPPGRFGDPLGGVGMGGGPGRPLHSPRRGVNPELVRAMPRVKWGDVVKLGGDGKLDERPPTAGSSSSSSGGSGSSSPSNEARAAADAAGSSALVGATGHTALREEEEAEEELCAVCLSGYEADDVLLRLPCEHLFHEQCIARWLTTDSTCPHCRFNLNHRPQPSRSMPPRGGAQRLADEESGTELVGRPVSSASSVPRAGTTPQSPQHASPQNVPTAAANAANRSRPAPSAILTQSAQSASADGESAFGEPTA